MKLARYDSAFKCSPSTAVPEFGTTSSLIEAIIHEWRNGTAADALAAIQKHPALWNDASLVVDLAYEEYCLRVKAGEAIEPSAFSRKFPGVEDAIARQIEFHRLIECAPDFLENLLEPKWPSVGDHFLGYLLLEEIGRGSFARVYRAEEVALGRRTVVVKVSTRGMAEANTLGKLNHPNIVPVHSVHLDSSRQLTAMCMPFLGTVTLQEVVHGDVSLTPVAKRWPLIWPTSYASHKSRLERERAEYSTSALRVVSALADALHFSHSLGVLHLDLKPSNVLMTREGIPKLLDFNLSVDKATASSVVGGTLPYMSPEQLSNFSAKTADANRLTIGPQADIYALGVLLFQLLTGRLPYEPMEDGTQTLQSTVTIQLKCQQRGLSSSDFPRGVMSRRLQDLILSCLAFDTSKRPSSMADVRDVLNAELSVSRRVARFIYLERRALGMAGCVALAITPLTLGREATRQEPLDGALTAYASKDYGTAIAETDKVLQSESGNPKAILVQALSRAQSGDFQGATLRFQQVRLSIRDPQVMCIAGYCCAKSRYYEDACGWYTDAIQAGFNEDADVFNNYGFVLLQRRRLLAARDSFERALQLDSAHVPAMGNLALTELLIARPQGSFPDRAIAAIESALEHRSDVGELHRDAAWIYAYAKSLNDAYESKTLLHLSLAVESGFNRRLLLNDPVLEPFISSGKTELRSDLAVTAPNTSSKAYERIVPHDSFQIDSTRTIRLLTADKFTPPGA